MCNMSATPARVTSARAGWEHRHSPWRQTRAHTAPDATASSPPTGG
jgi:hypothetical protein